MDIRDALGRVIERQDLSMEEMQAVMQQIMTGGASDAQIAAFLVALRMKGETVDEITAAASVMRELATPVALPELRHLVDIVGTGGDGANLFNVSTAATFVAAAAGCLWPAVGIKIAGRGYIHQQAPKLQSSFGMQQGPHGAKAVLVKVIVRHCLCFGLASRHVAS